jgi:hypothetical protein
MTDRKQKVLIQTPPFVAVWPKLQTPDTKFKAEGEYSVRARLDPAGPGVEAFRTKLDGLVADSLAKAQEENPKFAKVMKAVSPIKPELDDNGDETGFLILGLKKTAQVTSKKDGKVYNFRVNLYDAGLRPLAEGVQIGNGSLMVASFEPYLYFSAKDKEAGVSCRLEAVQVLDLVQYQGRDGASFGFQAVASENTDIPDEGDPENMGADNDPWGDPDAPHGT